MSELNSWTRFLDDNQTATAVTLVGPLTDRPPELNQPTIFVDGGVRWRPTQPHVPTIAVGDGDSSSELPKPSLDLLLPTAKDFSDFAFCLRDLPQNVHQVTLHGFLGGRRDHELAVLGEIHSFLHQRSHFTRVDLFEGQHLRMLAFCKGRVTLDLHGVFSVFTFDESAPVRIAGACAYPLERDPPLSRLSSLGLSNVGRGQVEIECGRPLFLTFEI